MLVQLFIQDIVLIDQLDIEFNAGLTVLTGETGAGKSIILDALSLALGARGDGSLVREGVPQGQVRAVFTLPESHAALNHLRDNDLLESSDISEKSGFVDITLRRLQFNDGRTRAYINDIPVAVSKLRDTGKMLVEIHGQHDERALVNEDSHRGILDAYGGLEKEVRRVSQAWKVWKAARKEFERLEKRALELKEDEDYLRSSVDELTGLSPQPGEEKELADKRHIMIQAQNMVSELSEVSEILSGSHSVIPALSSLVRKLERKAQQVPGLLEGVIKQLDGALNHLYVAQDELEEVLRTSEYDPHALENVEERLFSMRAAARKYNTSVEYLSNLAASMTEQLDGLYGDEDKLSDLEVECEERKTEYIRLADQLSQKRSFAGKQLIKKVQKEFPGLKLDKAEFLIRHESNEQLRSAYGQDRIEFHVRTNPGVRAGAMFRIASGGELSRFLLALKVALADKGSAPTLVFDEIDTGVGGAVADAIGARLAKLSEKIQTFSVTHAPQVAARAQHHFLISKNPLARNANQIITTVVGLDREKRRDEIARMLAGASITHEARAAADKLLEGDGLHVTSD